MKHNQLRSKQVTVADINEFIAKYNSFVDTVPSLREEYKERIAEEQEQRDRLNNLARATKTFNWVAAVLGVFWGIFNVVSVALALHSNDWEKKSGQLRCVEITAMVGNAGVLLVSLVGFVILVIQPKEPSRKAQEAKPPT
jgi:ABC-type multidrug transport system fused ATPase/permease subunit